MHPGLRRLLKLLRLLGQKCLNIIWIDIVNALFNSVYQDIGTSTGTVYGTMPSTFNIILPPTSPLRYQQEYSGLGLIPAKL
jgi:hypothetical protein